jgi:enoyl-CoA hydratase/carnithine racemase
VSGQEIRSELRDGLLELTLARPEKKNALTEAMYCRLASELAAAEEDGVSAVVFAAEGSMFCAGNDIADFKAIGSADVAQAPEDNAAFAFISALARTPLPLIAAVQGRAVGIGATMLLHCDLVFAAQDAALVFPFTGLGLVPEAGSTLLLPARLGHARAAAQLLLGVPLAADDAQAGGIVTEIVADAAAARGAALAAARRLHELPGEAVRATKRLMRDPLREQLEAQLHHESEEFAIRLRSPDAQAAFAALLGRGRQHAREQATTTTG